jgi:hypothetical protein
MTFGVQPIAIRDDFFMGPDGAGIKVNFKADPVNIDFYWAKPNEGKIYASDDNTIYALHGSGNIGESTLGAYASYQNFNSYPPDNTTDVARNPTTGPNLLDRPAGMETRPCRPCG